MKASHLLLCLILYVTGNSQRVVDVNKNNDPVNGHTFYTVAGFPVSTAKYVKLVSGSPYFSETWMKGTVFLNDSSNYNNIRVRLDLVEGLLYYLDVNDEEMVPVKPIKAVSMLDTITGRKYVFVHSSAVPGAPVAEKTWYQLISGEKAVLYKQPYKWIIESKAYGSSLVEQTVETDNRYFIGVNYTLTRVKSTLDIADLAGNKKQLLLDYIQKNRLNGKKETDFIAVVEYYNSLK